MSNPNHEEDSLTRNAARSPSEASAGQAGMTVDPVSRLFTTASNARTNSRRVFYCVLLRQGGVRREAYQSGGDSSAPATALASVAPVATGSGGISSTRSILGVLDESLT